jgi:hypothetical protein
MVSPWLCRGFFGLSWYFCCFVVNGCAWEAVCICFVGFRQPIGIAVGNLMLVFSFCFIAFLFGVSILHGCAVGGDSCHLNRALRRDLIKFLIA